MRRNSLPSNLLLAVALLAGSFQAHALKELSDQQLSDVTGQALFWSDKIAPNSLTGAGGADSSTDFTFYRMGLDTQLKLNMNIAKLQLGCGGANDALAGGCDIDMDYVRLMGRNGTDPGDPVTSDFILHRPYISYAIKNDDTKTLREIVGLKVGSQYVDGYLGVGRRYENGETNLEHGGVCGSGSDSVRYLNCHSGINSMSGALDVELSGQLPVSIDLGFLGSTGGMACMGNTSYTNDECGAGERLDLFRSGTRMDALVVRNQRLELDGGLVGILGSAYADVYANLRLVHGFALTNSDDFFLSVQRENVRWPTFTRSGYASEANTGWWMNTPNVKVLDFIGEELVMSLGDAIDALTEGVNVVNPELGSAPPPNCYGGAAFC